MHPVCACGLQGGSSVTMEGCTIRDNCKRGVSLEAGTCLEGSCCTFADNGDNGVHTSQVRVQVCAAGAVANFSVQAKPRRQLAGLVHASQPSACMLDGRPLRCATNLVACACLPAAQNARAFLERCVVAHNSKGGLRVQNASQVEAKECEFNGNMGPGVSVFHVSSNSLRTSRRGACCCGWVGNAIGARTYGAWVYALGTPGSGCWKVVVD